MKQTIKSWVYECDYPTDNMAMDSCDRWERVVVGDPVPNEQGSMKPAESTRVKDSKDADTVMRRRHEWSIGSAHFCKKHRVDT